MIGVLEAWKPEPDEEGIKLLTSGTRTAWIYSRHFYNAYGPSTPNPMHYQILCIIGNGMLYMTKQRGNLVNAQPYALPDFMHHLLCIIEISTVTPISATTSSVKVELPLQ